ncbi:MAG: ABC transporter ATP-binding protein [Bacteroidia bacterium]|nr:ABC transporter ATP-binding protein [Bacteroidia bacterium]MDW8348377.1 ABC transporter ATP-binding protein [Bacteroidia bacterium]
MDTGNIVLDIKDLETQFQSGGKIVKAVDKISFHVRKGQVVGIVGESGSGKSVTSLSVMRLVPNPPGRITGGEIWFNSPKQGRVNLLELSEKEMRSYRGSEIAMIFQEPMTSLNPVFTCGSQVMEALQIHQKLTEKQARERTLELFKEVQLSNPEQIFKAFPHQLSGGQKQRVMIAMAISCHPSLLIADEPTTALDVTIQAAVLKLLQRFQKSYNMGMIFITHDLGVIAEIADYVLVMYHGKIVEQGNVEDIFLKPQHPYTKGLLACRPRLDVKLRVLPTVVDFIEQSIYGDIEKSQKSVEEIITSRVISESEIKAHNQRLKAQEPILKIEHLKTYFPIKKSLFGKILEYKRAVDDVSLCVYPGEVLGLVGESGCGKSTLGRSILRLVEPISGRIYYKGQDILQLSPRDLRKVRREIQIIFQDPYSSLNPRLSVGYAIMEPMKVHNILNNDEERRRRVYELLERVNLNPNFFNRYPHEFSGGQRQRICIARALALNPKFIICDESVSALDVSVQAQVLNLINELKAEYNFTCIFISHDLSVVKFMSDRVAVMKSGKIVEIDEAENIYKSPKEKYTQDLISAIPKGISANKNVGLNA